MGLGAITQDKNGPPLFSEGDEGGGGLTKTRVSEAKGPFPGGKRVGSRGKKKKNAGVKARGKRDASMGRKRKKCLM